MKTITIKQRPNNGADTKVFRAYGDLGHGSEVGLDISASTTGNVAYGVIRCAAKAFVKYEEPHAKCAEVETRIKITELPNLVWRAELTGTARADARPTAAAETRPAMTAAEHNAFPKGRW
jgi:hypothetical protein